MAWAKGHLEAAFYPQAAVLGQERYILQEIRR
jgi:hypothetical protein